MEKFNDKIDNTMLFLILIYKGGPTSTYPQHRHKISKKIIRNYHIVTDSNSVARGVSLFHVTRKASGHQFQEAKNNKYLILIFGKKKKLREMLHSTSI